MTSEKKAAANRKNALKSRGPRTSAGKARVSRNALQHGLAATAHMSVLNSDLVEALAHQICAGDSNPLLIEQARIIAENELILRCVRSQHIALIEGLRQANAPAGYGIKARLRFAKARLGDANSVLAALTSPSARPDNPNFVARERTDNIPKPPPTVSPVDGRDECEAVRLAVRYLQRLSRYARRALSRQKRAIGDFIAVKSRSIKDEMPRLAWDTAPQPTPFSMTSCRKSHLRPRRQMPMPRQASW